MRAVQVMIAIALLWCGAALADSMEGHGTASGNVVLWFSGTNATATFEGSFALTGQLMLNEVGIPFSASGWARGAGSGDTATLDVEAWATFTATGWTESGEAIAVQGGLTLAGLSADTAGSSGSGTGDFFATVFMDGQQYYVQGSADGSAAGGFVMPEDPMSMELAGDGFFNLSGNMTVVSLVPQAEGSAESDPETQATSAVAELLPWDLETWPEELLAHLLEILTGIVETPPETQADSETE